MIKLKDILGEQGTNFGRRGKFYPGSKHNDEPFDFKDDKSSRPTMPTPKEWDDLMDRVNNDPRFETYTGKDGYQIKDTKGPSSNLIWQLTPGRFGWSGIGRASAEHPHPRQFNDVAALIKNFYEVTGLSGLSGDSTASPVNSEITERFLQVIKTKFSQYNIVQKQNGSYEFVYHTGTPYARIMFDPNKIGTPYAVSYIATFAPGNIRIDADEMKKELAQLS